MKKHMPLQKKALSLLGIGLTISAAAIAPKATFSVGKRFWEKEDEWKDWRKFNQAYLRQTLRRLEKQKLVEIKDLAGKQRITITDKGKTKILEYAIEELEILKPRE